MVLAKHGADPKAEVMSIGPALIFEAGAARPAAGMRFARCCRGANISSMSNGLYS